MTLLSFLNTDFRFSFFCVFRGQIISSLSGPLLLRFKSASNPFLNYRIMGGKWELHGTYYGLTSDLQRTYI